MQFCETAESQDVIVHKYNVLRLCGVFPPAVYLQTQRTENVARGCPFNLSCIILHIIDRVVGRF